MRNYFILDGIDSRDFGVYISGQGTFSAPQKAYQFYNIPGRNGALLGNEHRFENINVSYEAFIYSNFDANIAAFRTFLLSLNGYKRLTDSYHPDEYRMAVYTGPFEPKVERTNDCGSFTITFSCKPQRWLLSGDTTYSWASGTDQTITGKSLDVYGPRIDPAVLSMYYSMHVSSEIMPNYYYDPQTQTTRLIGYNIPKTPNNPSFSPRRNSCSLKIDGETVHSQTMAGNYFTEATFDFANGTFTKRGAIATLPTSGWTQEGSGLFSHSLSNTALVYSCSHYSRSPQLAYLNGTYSVTAGFGFYFDTGTSKLYIRDSTKASVSSFQNWLSSLSTNPVEIDYLMTTASTQTIPTYTPTYPSRFITVSGNDFSVTLQYTSGDSMANPTAFPSQPLIRVYGNGSFYMDGIVVTVTNATEYTDIDCELMDCYEGSTNRNNDVSFSTYDFPTLQPGENDISIISGITFVMIQPRWWQV